MDRNKFLGRALVALTLLTALLIQLRIAGVPDEMGDFSAYQNWGRAVHSLGINDAYFQSDSAAPVRTVDSNSVSDTVTMSDVDDAPINVNYRILLIFMNV